MKLWLFKIYFDAVNSIKVKLVGESFEFLSQICLILIVKINQELWHKKYTQGNL